MIFAKMVFVVYLESDPPTLSFNFIKLRSLKWVSNKFVNGNYSFLRRIEIFCFDFIYFVRKYRMTKKLNTTKGITLRSNNDAGKTLAIKLYLNKHLLRKSRDTRYIDVNSCDNLKCITTHHSQRNIWVLASFANRSIRSAQRRTFLRIYFYFRHLLFC